MESTLLLVATHLQLVAMASNLVASSYRNPYIDPDNGPLEECFPLPASSFQGSC